MKKIGACMLAIGLFLANAAVAQESRPLRMGGFVDEAAYWKEHGIPISMPNYHGEHSAALMQLPNAPDWYGADSGQDDIRAMKEAGVLADLSGSTVICEAVEQMRPEIQRLITDDAGGIVCLPFTASISPIYRRPDAWNAAGLNDIDIPGCYTELLDFAQAWADRVKNAPEPKVCFAHFASGTHASTRYVEWLTEILIDTWEMQYYEAGLPLDFDTPEFIALLERTRDIGELLGKVEPGIKKGKQMMPLFWDPNRRNGSAEGTYNDGREEGLSHALAFRIHREQPVLIRGRVSLFCIRAGSPYADQIIPRLEQRIIKPTALRTVDLYREGVLPGTYGKSQREQITAGWIQDRSDYGGNISFAPLRSRTQYESAIMSFMKGKLSAERLARMMSAQ